MGLFCRTMEDISKEHIQEFIRFLRFESDYDFSGYSIKSFTRRLNKMVSDKGKSIPEIIEDMRENPKLIDSVAKSITVNTTELFRDPEIWKIIRQDIFPKYSAEKQINIWHPGVSTGQEAYSMMVIADEAGVLDQCRIIGTDLNEDVLAVAESGKYKYREIDEYIENYRQVFGSIDSPPMKNYFNFSKRKSLITVSGRLTKKIRFVKHDLTRTQNPLDAKYHMIICRNLLIYFDHDTQNRIFKFFYDQLHPGGTLVIGRHEGILSDIVSRFDKRGTIYIKKQHVSDTDY